MSFWIFFLLLFIVTIDIPICFCKKYEFVEISSLITIPNCIAIGSILFLLLGVLFYYQFKNRLKGDLDVPVTIIKIDNINYEYFALLMTIVSLISLDFKTVRGLVLLLILLVIMCAIFIKTELFYSNPSFALLGFHIYRAETNNLILSKSIFITKDKIKEGDKVKYLKISEKVYFTKKV